METQRELRGWEIERKKDIACLPRHGQENSITARSPFWSIQSLFSFFCVCFQFSQELLLLLYLLQPSSPQKNPPTQKKRESFYGLLFPVRTISLPQSQACILCLKGSELHKGPVLWQPVVGMMQKSGQNSRHCHPPLRDPRKQKCREFERLGKERSCAGGQGHILLYTISHTQRFSQTCNAALVGTECSHKKNATIGPFLLVHVQGHVFILPPCFVTIFQRILGKNKSKFFSCLH